MIKLFVLVCVICILYIYLLHAERETTYGIKQYAYQHKINSKSHTLIEDESREREPTRLDILTLRWREQRSLRWIDHRIFI